MAVHLYFNIPNEKFHIIQSFDTIESVDKFTSQFDSIDKFKKAYQEMVLEKCVVTSQLEKVNFGIWDETTNQFFTVFTKYENGLLRKMLSNNDFIYHLVNIDYSRYQKNESVSERLFDAYLIRDLYKYYRSSPSFFKELVRSWKKGRNFRKTKEQILNIYNNMTMEQKEKYQLPFKDIHLVHKPINEVDDSVKKITIHSEDESAYCVDDEEEKAMYDEMPAKRR